MFCLPISPGKPGNPLSPGLPCGPRDPGTPCSPGGPAGPGGPGTPSLPGRPVLFFIFYFKTTHKMKTSTTDSSNMLFPYVCIDKLIGLCVISLLFEYLCIFIFQCSPVLARTDRWNIVSNKVLENKVIHSLDLVIFVWGLSSKMTWYIKCLKNLHQFFRPGKYIGQLKKNKMELHIKSNIFFLCMSINFEIHVAKKIYRWKIHYKFKKNPNPNIQ